MPCHRFLYRPEDWLGTVEQPKLSPARERYLHLKSSDILDCEGCMAKMVCGGGCRVVALNQGLTLKSSYASHCITMRAHARAAMRIHDTLVGEQNPVFTSRFATSGNAGGAYPEWIYR